MWGNDKLVSIFRETSFYKRYIEIGVRRYNKISCACRDLADNYIPDDKYRICASFFLFSHRFYHTKIYLQLKTFNNRKRKLNNKFFNLNWLTRTSMWYSVKQQLKLTSAWRRCQLRLTALTGNCQSFVHTEFRRICSQFLLQGAFSRELAPNLQQSYAFERDSVRLLRSLLVVPYPFRTTDIF